MTEDTEHQPETCQLTEPSSLITDHRHPSFILLYRSYSLQIVHSLFQRLRLFSTAVLHNQTGRNRIMDDKKGKNGGSEEGKSEDWETVHESSSAHRPVLRAVAASPSSQRSPQTSFITSSNHSMRSDRITRSFSVPMSRDQEDRLELIRQKVDTKVRLKRNLVDHPIQLLWSRFIFHFYGEITLMDRTVQNAILLIFCGVVLQIVLMSTWYLLFPRECARLLVLLILVAVPFLYLNPNLVENMAKSIENMFTSQEALSKALASFESAQLRKLAYFLLIVPTLLEMWALHFLSQVHANVSWIYFYNLVVACALSGLAVYLYHKKRMTPRECTHRSILLLYGAALISVTMLVLCHHHTWEELYRALALIAPTLIATGILLLNDREPNEFLTRAVRLALRLALRDVLENVGSAVRQDEMLQLAMLRWIVDYWSNSPGNQNGSNRTASPVATPEPTAAPVPSARPAAPSGASASSSTTLLQKKDAGAIEWSDLFPMLAVTTDQLAIEVKALQGPKGKANQSSRDSKTTRNQTDSHRPNERPGSHSHRNVEPVMNLQHMLASMDIDEHAKPAVAAYRRGVEAFPPQPRMSSLLSIVRRCPALWLFIGHFLFGWSCSFSASLILLPLVALEVLRVEAWARSLSENQDGSFLENLQHLDQVDSMVLLLSDDDYLSRRPPSLLVVWRNICDSVNALETSLTAARCVQTTAVAVDFASNILSLAQFGLDISQHGWAYGVGVLVKEWVVSQSSSSPGRPSAGTNYTQSARNIVGNSQILHRNISELLGERDIGRFFAPLLGLVPAAMFGWMLQPGSSESQSSHEGASTVVIEEVNEHVNDGDSEALVTKTSEASGVGEKRGLSSSSCAGDSSSSLSRETDRAPTEKKITRRSSSMYYDPIEESHGTNVEETDAKCRTESKVAEDVLVALTTPVINSTPQRAQDTNSTKNTDDNVSQAEIPCSESKKDSRDPLKDEVIQKTKSDKERSATGSTVRTVSDGAGELHLTELKASLTTASVLPTKANISDKETEHSLNDGKEGLSITSTESRSNLTQNPLVAFDAASGSSTPRTPERWIATLSGTATNTVPGTPTSTRPGNLDGVDFESIDFDSDEDFLPIESTGRSTRPKPEIDEVFSANISDLVTPIRNQRPLTESGENSSESQNVDDEDLDRRLNEDMAKRIAEKSEKKPSLQESAEGVKTVLPVDLSTDNAGNKGDHERVHVEGDEDNHILAHVGGGLAVVGGLFGAAAFVGSALAGKKTNEGHPKQKE